MDRLVEQGTVDPATRMEVAVSRLGVAVAGGAARPVMGTPDEFVAALLAARSVAYSRAGASGIYFKGLIERLGHRGCDQCQGDDHSRRLHGGEAGDG